MNPLVILEIVKLSLELALEIVHSIPKAQHEAFWIQHQKDVAFWRDVFEKLSGKEPK